MGIVLLIVGALLFVASFIIPDSGNDGKRYSKAMGLKLDRMIDERVEQVKGRLSDVAVTAREEEELRAKRELERLTNEKIMAIEDYSKVVMEEIEKNHQEVMFLYDMLDNKSSDLKNTLRKADAVKKEQEPVSEPVYAEEEKQSVSGVDRLKSAMEAAGIEREEPLSEEGEAPAGGELSRNEKVLEMKKQGMDNVEIAKSLNIGVGEVNLITDLFSSEEENGGGA